MIYIVSKVGIYIQGIAGCFTDPEKAKEEARELARTCRDSYHDYVVEEIPLDCSLRAGFCGWSGHEFKELNEIARFSKDKLNGELT